MYDRMYRKLASQYRNRLGRSMLRTLRIFCPPLTQVSQNVGIGLYPSAPTGAPVLLKTQYVAIVSFLPRDAMHKRGLCRHAVSVRLSRSWIMSKQIKISSNFFTIG